MNYFLKQQEGVLALTLAMLIATAGLWTVVKWVQKDYFQTKLSIPFVEIALHGIDNYHWYPSLLGVTGQILKIHQPEADGNKDA